MKKTLFGIGILGVLFSGYLSAVKLFSNTCAFNESCPYFLGYPACYYGFVMFALIAILSGFWYYGKGHAKTLLNRLALVSFIGIIFSGYFVIQEIPNYVSTCSLGLIFYVVVFVLSIMAHSRE